jgi:hypothetical protein
VIFIDENGNDPGGNQRDEAGSHPALAACHDERDDAM